MPCDVDLCGPTKLIDAVLEKLGIFKYLISTILIFIYVLMLVFCAVYGVALGAIIIPYFPWKMHLSYDQVLAFYRAPVIHKNSHCKSPTSVLFCSILGRMGWLFQPCCVHVLSLLHKNVWFCSHGANN